MRIAWNEGNAQAVAGAIKDIRHRMETCARQSGQVRRALEEANPGGGNRRLKAIEARFESAVARLNRASEEAVELETATNRMIMLFEESDREVMQIVNALNVGAAVGTGEGIHAPVRIGGYDPQLRRPPIALPTPRIAPVPRFSAAGPVPRWLEEMMNQQPFSLNR